MAETQPVTEPYSDGRQQHAAAMMGMYIFLGSEAMLFGGIFVVAAVSRVLHPAAIVEASKSLHYFIGALNTAILLTTSFFVALATEAGKHGRRSVASSCLIGAALLGIGFLAVKAYEYSLEYSENLLPLPGAETHFLSASQHLFMNLYLIATSLHALHLLIGIALLTVLAFQTAVGKLQLPQRSIVVIVAGLYWHLVDVIWVFLYPVFYLAR